MTSLEERKESLEQSLRRTRLLSREAAVSLAEYLAKEEYRRERHSRWLADGSFVSRQAKVRYQCAQCGYWRVCKRRNESRMLHTLRFCPQCGAVMANAAPDPLPRQEGGYHEKDQ